MEQNLKEILTSLGSFEGLDGLTDLQDKSQILIKVKEALDQLKFRISQLEILAQDLENLNSLINAL